MNRFVPWVVLLLGVAGAMACGRDAATAVMTDVKYPDLGSRDVPDTAGQEGLNADAEEVRYDGTDAETALETDDVAVESETVEDVGPVPGGPGYPCTANGDCNSGVCIDSANGKVCAQQCLDTCPDGYVCKALGSNVLICLPLFLHLCDPCLENSECNAGTTGGSTACVDTGEGGKFCGGDCKATGFCPAGYACKDAPDPHGQKSKQCVPAAGAECACSLAAINAGAKTGCYVKNDFGICTGERRCIVSGLSQCNAKTPEKEICDGLDNNCDGVADENLGTQADCDQHEAWDGIDHVCMGKGECLDGHIVNCDAATPARETCNGLDDDCNGLTDDACDDLNPCTTDFCNPGDGTCGHTPRSGSQCSTGDPCSVNDQCDDTGTCISGGKKFCDDGNPCTDDLCDGVTGECTHPNNTASCEDGDFCTIGDHCSNGACSSGAPKSCVADNTCRKITGCDKKTGECLWGPANEKLPCTGTNKCQTNTQCSNGDCTGGADVCTLKSCPVPADKTTCGATPCSLVGAPWGLLCPCVCL